MLLTNTSFPHLLQDVTKYTGIPNLTKQLFFIGFISLSHDANTKPFCSSSSTEYNQIHREYVILRSTSSFIEFISLSCEAPHQPEFSSPFTGCNQIHREYLILKSNFLHRIHLTFSVCSSPTRVFLTFYRM